jgi:enediyne biosynthesis protein E4
MRNMLHTEGKVYDLLDERLTLFLSVLLLLSVSCNSGTAASSDPDSARSEDTNTKLFRLLSSAKTGIEFTNILNETNEINFYQWDYLYNGGGSAIGDLDNDGLPEVYFTGTISEDKLYRNKGNLTFEDISNRSGIGNRGGLKTGVTMVDINNDGLLDIYVCRSGFFKDESTHENLLYVNQGNLKFSEMAAEYGLNDSGNSIHAGFFDYDMDGDLDCYITSHPGFRLKYKEVFAGIANPSDKESDKLYRNDNGKFTNISRAAGVHNFGHGLGLGISDLNNDGHTDVYVANDFQLPDFYYVNQGNGTFTDQVKNAFPHCPYFSMGTDIADFNNDGLLDIFIVEMLAADNKRKKTNMASMNPELFWKHVDAGFHYQYMRNALQLNNGNGTFTDIADFAGIRNTDWSWAPVFADLDNDGLKDLIVTNGYIRDTQDKDYLNKTSDIAAQRGGSLSFEELQEHMISTPLENYAYQNTGGYRFEDKSEEWGFDFSGFSNGAALGDLDADGDLDIVVNNFFDPACVYENTATNIATNNYIRLKFEGPTANINGLGTKATIHLGDGLQYQEFQVTRGFQSCMEPFLHFGLGKEAIIDRLEIVWSDGSKQSLQNVSANQLLTVKYDDAKPDPISDDKQQPGLFRPIGPSNGSIFTHKENNFNDYEKEILLPHKMSQWGPALAVGDVNGDGLDDFYVGGAAGQSAVLFIQDGPLNITTISTPTWASDAAHEDVAAHFFDADGDGDQDLYVVSGGNEFSGDAPELQDRLYLNQGNRKFTRSKDALPSMLTSGGVATSVDFDGDEDLDLFVGGRVVPGKYPVSPRSYILENTNGKFEDVTNRVAPGLVTPGLITSAKWTDYDGDNKPDLIAAGEWTGIIVFQNVGGKLENRSNSLGLDKHVGWWFDIHETDVDNDGDPDYVLGNLGLNYKYRATNEEPFHIYCHDFDQSGNLDIVLGYYNQGECFPVRGRQCSSQQMPFIKKKFPTYNAFGEANLFDVYGQDLDTALHYAANDFASSLLINNGDGSFTIKQLPTEIQFAPVMSTVSDDFNGDGHQDLFVAGNLHVSEVETPRADGGTGKILLGNGDGTFHVVGIKEAGIYTARDVRNVALLSTGNGNPGMIVTANNNSGVQLFLQNNKPVELSDADKD